MKKLIEKLKAFGKWLSKLIVKPVPVPPGPGPVVPPVVPPIVPPVEPPIVPPVVPPGPVPPPGLRALKIYESPRRLKIAALYDTPRGMLVCEYDTFSRKRSVIRLISDLNLQIHDGREETIQAPAASANVLIFPAERHKEGLIVLDRATLRKTHGLSPRHEICIAAGIYNGRPIVGSSPYPVGNAVIQDALTGAVLKILSPKGVVSGISGSMCVVRSDGNGDHCVLDWTTGKLHELKCTCITTWWGSTYVGTGDGKIAKLSLDGDGYTSVDLGAPVYSVCPDASALWITTSNPNRLWRMDINGKTEIVDEGLHAKLGWFGLPVAIDAAGRVCWAEWDEKRELSIVWRMEAE